MPTVCMINICAASGRRQDWARGELGCPAGRRQTSADPQGTLKPVWLLRVDSIWGEGKKRLYPQHLRAFGRQLSLQGDVTWGKAVFFRLGSFWKGWMAENHQLINYPGVGGKEIL